MYRDDYNYHKPIEAYEGMLPTQRDYKAFYIFAHQINVKQRS
jgi:hypothetical protein